MEKSWNFVGQLQWEPCTDVRTELTIFQDQIIFVSPFEPDKVSLSGQTLGFLTLS